MSWKDDLSEWAYGRDFEKSHDLYVNFEQVDALLTTLSDIKENEVETARKDTQDAIDALNKTKGFSEYVGQLSSCDETYDYINQLIDTISTTVNSIANDIYEFEQAMDSGAAIGGTLFTSWMSLGEGTFQVGEWIGDGIASIGGWTCLLFGDEDTAGKIADWIEEDHTKAYFEDVWSEVGNYSTFTHDSAISGALKTIGEVSTIITAGNVLTPLAESAIGGETTTVLGGKVTLSANTIADAVVAADTGYGSGFEKSLKNTSGTGDSTTSRYLKATGSGIVEGGKDATISLVVGGAGDTFAANKAAKLTKGASNVDDEAKVLKAADDVDDGTKALKNVDDAGKEYSAIKDDDFFEITDSKGNVERVKVSGTDDVAQKAKAEDLWKNADETGNNKITSKDGSYESKQVTQDGKTYDVKRTKTSSGDYKYEIVNESTKTTTDATKVASKVDDATTAAKKTSAEDLWKEADDASDYNMKGDNWEQKSVTKDGTRYDIKRTKTSTGEYEYEIVGETAPKKAATTAYDRINDIKASDSSFINKAKTTITTAGKTALEAAGKTPRTSSAISATAVAVNNNNNSSDTQFKSNIDSKTVPVSKTPATGGNENLSSKDIPGDDTTPKDENVDGGGGNQSYVPSGNYSPSDTTNNDTGNTESNEQFKEEIGTIEDKIEQPKDDTPKDTTPKDTTPKDDTPVDDTPKDTTPKDDTPSDDKVIVTPTPTDTTPIITQNPTDGGGTTTTGGGYSRSGGYTASNTTPTTPVDEIKNSVRDIDEIIGGNNKTYKQIPKSSSVITKKATSGAGSSVIPIAAGLSAAAAAGIGAKAYIDRKKNNDNGEDEDDFDTEEWSEDGNLDIDYSDDSDTKVEENLIDEDNDNYDDSDNYSNDNYAYQEVEEEKYGARNNEELADLQ